MQPTSDERREVAAKLSDEAQAWRDTFPDEVCYLGVVSALMQDLCHFAGLRGKVSHAEIFQRFADLIEPQERTCTNESASGKYFKCSECGAELMQITPGWVALVRGRVNYCPNCGARVTGGARITEVVEDA